MRLEGVAKGGYYPTPKSVLKEIVKLISIENRFQRRNYMEYPILDPCAGDGAAAMELKRLLLEKQARKGVPENNQWTFPLYGIELNQERSETAMENLDYVIGQDFFRCALSHNSFSIIYLNPPYDYDREDKRMEHRFLTRCHNYLMPGGLLIYVIPRQTLKTSAAFLSAHYSDYRWQVYQFPEPEYQDYKQIVFLEQKNEKNGNEASVADQHMKAELIRISEEENKLTGRDLSDWGNRVYMTTRMRIDASDYFYLQGRIPEEIMFVAYQIDPQQMQGLVNKHGLWKEKEIRQLTEYVSELKQQPLMPLRRGHLALFIAAGFLNNMELTDDETGERILIKGNSYKETHARDEGEGKIIEQEVLSVKIRTLSLETGLLTEIV